MMAMVVRIPPELPIILQPKAVQKYPMSNISERVLFFPTVCGAKGRGINSTLLQTLQWCWSSLLGNEKCILVFSLQGGKSVNAACGRKKNTHPNMFRKFSQEGAFYSEDMHGPRMAKEGKESSTAESRKPGNGLGPWGLVLDIDLDRKWYADWMTVQKGSRHPLLHACFGLKVIVSFSILSSDTPWLEAELEGITSCGPTPGQQ